MFSIPLDMVRWYHKIRLEIRKGYKLIPVVLILILILHKRLGISVYSIPSNVRYVLQYEFKALAAKGSSRPYYAQATEYSLDKEQASFNDSLDALILSLKG